MQEPSLVSELFELIKIAKDNGLSRLKFYDIEFELKSEPIRSEIPQDQLVPRPSLIEGMPGDDEMLLYSTPSFDELIAERAEEPNETR